MSVGALNPGFRATSNALPPKSFWLLGFGRKKWKVRGGINVRYLLLTFFRVVMWANDVKYSM